MLVLTSGIRSAFRPSSKRPSSRSDCRWPSHQRLADPDTWLVLMQPTLIVGAMRPVFLVCARVMTGSVITRARSRISPILLSNLGASRALGVPCAKPPIEPLSFSWIQQSQQLKILGDGCFSSLGGNLYTKIGDVIIVLRDRESG